MSGFGIILDSNFLLGFRIDGIATDFYVLAGTWRLHLDLKWTLISVSLICSFLTWFLPNILVCFIYPLLLYSASVSESYLHSEPLHLQTLSIIEYNIIIRQILNIWLQFILDKMLNFIFPNSVFKISWVTILNVMNSSRVNSN